MKKNLFLLILGFSLNVAFSQGYFVTKTGDTINYLKIDKKRNVNKYWTNEMSKPIKIKESEIIFYADYPKYSFEIKEKDEFTGEYKTLTTRVNIGRDKNSKTTLLRAKLGNITLDKKSEYFIYVNPVIDIGCVGSEVNYIMIKFIDGGVIKLEKDLADIDCQMNRYSIYYLNNKDLSKLKNEKIKSIRVQNSKFFMDFEVVIPDFMIKKINLIQKN